MADTFKKRRQLLNKLNEKNQNAHIGLSKSDEYLSFGNYVLNFNASEDFCRGVPNKRSILLWGESGTGKSFLLGNLAKDAQSKGYHVMYIDTENALNEKFLKKIGINIDEEHFTTIRATSVGAVTKIMSDCLKTYLPEDKICYIIDSISNLTTDSGQENFTKGVVKGDMGQLAKQLKQMVTDLNGHIGDRDNFLIMSGHAYMNQNVMNGEGTWLFSGGKGVIFQPSISMLLTKLKLKNDDTKKISGVKITAEVTKSRYTQLGRQVRLEVPYSTGLDPYDGLLDVYIEADYVTQAGAWYSYQHEGKEVKFQKKNFEKHAEVIFDFKAPTDITESPEGGEALPD